MMSRRSTTSQTPREVTVQQLIDAVRNAKRFHGPDFAAGGSGQLGFAAPVLQASFEVAPDTSQTPAPAPPLDRISPAEFEELADRARRDFHKEQHTGQPVRPMPELRPAVLMEALTKIHSAVFRHRAGLKTDPGLGTTSGIQIVGVRIRDAGGDSSSNVVRLSNARLPFSVRLIGCLIEAPLMLSNCELVTLDLSGSAMAGIDATFLKASGSVRMRRCYVDAPADFGGAQIQGSFDATDAIFKPFGVCPPTQSFDGDRGMLNLAQATIGNETLLDRATIWGGLSMRGMTARRSVHLDEASVLSPLAVLEAMAIAAAEHELPANPPVAGNGLPSWAAIGSRQRDVPVRSKPHHYQVGRQAWAAEAWLVGTARMNARSPAEWSKRSLWKLLTDSVRARTSAIRADGSDIQGSLFGGALSCHGRFRLKYATIQGATMLDGSRLRSVEAIRHSFDCLNLYFSLGLRQNKPLPTVASAGPRHLLTDIASFRISTYGQTVSKEEFKKDTLAAGSDYRALDLRDTRLGGNLNIGHRTAAAASQQTWIDGSIAASRAQIDGDFSLRGSSFQWSIRAAEWHPSLGTATAEELKTLKNYARKPIPEKLKDCRDFHNERLKRGDLYAIDCEGIRINGSLLLDSTSGVAGVNGDGAAIGADIAFYGTTQRVMGEAKIAVRSPALSLTGRVSLAGVTVGGDCRLIFDAKTGPSILLENAAVSSELSIIGVPDPSMQIDLTTEKFEQARDRYREEWREAELAAYPDRSGSAATDHAWQAYVGKMQAKPGINLRNAKAVVFSHMPAAWPVTGKLDIAGFRYERANDIGPLAPHPFQAPGTGAEKHTRHQSYAVIAIGVVVAMVHFGIFQSRLPTRLTLTGVTPTWMMPPWVTPPWLTQTWLTLTGLVPTWLRDFGHQTADFIERARLDPNASMLGLAAVIVAAGLHRMLPTITPPYWKDSEPLGITYLRLQRLERNRYRNVELVGSFYERWRYTLLWPIQWPIKAVYSLNFGAHWTPPPRRGNVYHSLESYGVAARALRESGRALSANLLEQRRLQMRTGQLSWRVHFIPKLSFKCVDWLAHYGFSYVRVALLSAALVFLTAIVANDAAANKALVAATPFDAIEVGASQTDKLVADPACVSLRPADLRAKDGPACKVFPSVAYGLDMIVPGFDFGTRGDWQFDEAATTPLWQSYATWIVLLRLAGIAVFGLFLLGVSSWVATLVGRFAD